MLSCIFFGLFGLHAYNGHRQNTQRKQYLNKASPLTDYPQGSTDGVKYTNVILTTDKPHIVEGKSEEYITKLVLEQDIYIRRSVSNGIASQYTFTVDGKKHFHPTNLRPTSYLNIANLLPRIHELYSKGICTIRTESNGNFNFANTALYVGKEGDYHASNDQHIGKQHVLFGVPNDGAQYLIIGDFIKPQFLPNDNLIIDRNKTFQTLEAETDDNINYYRRFGITTGVIGALFAIGEVICYTRIKF